MQNIDYIGALQEIKQHMNPTCRELINRHSGNDEATYAWYRDIEKALENDGHFEIHPQYTYNELPIVVNLNKYRSC